MADNEDEGSYKFVGAASLKNGFKYSAHAQIKNDSSSVKALVWFFGSLKNTAERTRYPNTKFYKAGRCSRCNHILTVPSSIKRMMGDCCYDKIIEEGNYTNEQSYNTNTNQLRLDLNK